MKKVVEKKFEKFDVISETMSKDHWTWWCNSLDDSKQMQDVLFDVFEAKQVCVAKIGITFSFWYKK